MTISYPDWEYTYRAATQDEVEALMSLIEAAKPSSSSDTSEIVNIINEEAETYYQGQKTVDEVVEIIQNRIWVYYSTYQKEIAIDDGCEMFLYECSI